MVTLACEATNFKWMTFFLTCVCTFCDPTYTVTAFVPKPFGKPTKSMFNPFEHRLVRELIDTRHFLLFDRMYAGHGTVPATALAALASADDELNRIEIGIQTSQILMDDRRRNELKKDIRREFPLVPESLIDSGIDITAQAFTKVVPEKLQAALRPGGMELMRPEMEQVIVDYALEQPAVQNVPVLQKHEKRNIIKAIVSVALDCVLKDAQAILAAPEVRLEQLEEQIREIKARMGFSRLVIYRVRRNRKRILVGAVVSLIAMIMYQQQSHPLVAQCFSCAGRASTVIATVVQNCSATVSSMISTTMKNVVKMKRAITAIVP